MTTRVIIQTAQHSVKVLKRDPTTKSLWEKQIVGPNEYWEAYLHSGLSIEVIEIPFEKET